ncbi:MAG: hypothetical protein NVSMB17_05720 [Candidatus Dormibacteria bacterium]
MRAGQVVIPPSRRGRTATLSAVALTGILAVIFIAVAVRGSLGVTPAGTHTTTRGPSPSPAGSVVGEFTPWLPLPEAVVPPPSPSPSPASESPPAGLNSCRANRLQVRPGRSHALSGGQVVRSVVVRSTASTRCYLEGSPTPGVFSAGRPVPVAVAHGYLPDFAVRVAVLEPGSAPFPSASDSTEVPDLMPGWASLAYQWVDCRGAVGTSVVFDLPSGGGRLAVSQDSDRPAALCYGDITTRFVAVSPFLPAPSAGVP